MRFVTRQMLNYVKRFGVLYRNTYCHIKLTRNLASIYILSQNDLFVTPERKKVKVKDNEKIFQEM